MQARQHQVHDLEDLLLGEGVEDNDLVNAIEQFGAEHIAQGREHAVAHLLVMLGALLFGPIRLRRSDELAADVRGHDQNRVVEVHDPPGIVGEPAILQDLQQDVEHIGVGLLDLVEQDNPIGPATHRLGELAPLLVADVPRGRADETRDSVPLHVLRHVNPDHRVFVVEHELGKGLGELRLANTGRAKEDE